jgi:hypothetical protein
MGFLFFKAMAHDIDHIGQIIRVEDRLSLSGPLCSGKGGRGPFHRMFLQGVLYDLVKLGLNGYYHWQGVFDFHLINNKYK